MKKKENKQDKVKKVQTKQYIQVILRDKTQRKIKRKRSKKEKQK